MERMNKHVRGVVEEKTSKRSELSDNNEPCLDLIVTHLVGH